MKAFHSILWMVLVSITGACAQQSLDEKLKTLYEYSVPLVQPEQLATWQTEPSEVVLLDIRSAPEYAVSHIAGAQLVDYDSFKNQDVTHIKKNAKVVVYCSVGYRSERIGEKLQDLGYTEVYNLYGGIFQWKNVGYQVVDPEGRTTERVHTYNKSWSQWLDKGVKVYE